MRKILTIAILFVAFVFLVSFFVANRQPMVISFDPSSQTDPALFLGPMPMWAALAGTLFIGFAFGVLGMWLSDGSLRRKARERKIEIRRLKEQIAMMDDEPPASKGPRLPALRRG